MCGYMCAATHFMCVKFKVLHVQKFIIKYEVGMFSVAHGFVVHTCEINY